MTPGIIIHVAVGREKKTELFPEERIRIGSDAASDLQIRTEKIPVEGMWFEIARENDDVYRIVQIEGGSNFLLNGEPLRRFAEIKDGDVISNTDKDINFSFFAFNTKNSLIATNRDQTQVAHFIEEAAIDAAASPKRDEAKAFLREFVRELSREVSWTTKLIVLVLAMSFIGAILYLGISFNKELKISRQQSEQQGEIIKRLEDQLAQNNEQLGSLDKTNKDLIKTVSLAPNLRVQYGNGVCLIVGVYDLVDKRSGKTLRYPDPTAYQSDPYEPVSAETGEPTAPQPAANAPQGLTTEGGGTPVEYDFIGTGFHVGGGYILTNRHVLQPWEEDDMVKQLMKQSNGRARIKRLIAYFPTFPQSFPLKIQKTAAREDLGTATIDPNLVSPDIPVLPLDTSDDAVAIGKTVVTIGYPSGPDRLLAMLDDSEIKSLNSKFGSSRQALLAYLAQAKKITPLTTPGAITDLDPRRIVHDAKTAEGGSGAPLFGQSGKVIGVNFGVFTENTASNMAVPVKFAIDLLKSAGWQTPAEKHPAPTSQTGDNNVSQPAASNPG